MYNKLFLDNKDFLFKLNDNLNLNYIKEVFIYIINTSLK